MKIIFIFFFLLLFLLLITISKEGLSEIISFDSKYPNSITLNNGNILIVAEDGLFLYDIILTKISIVLNFTSGASVHTTFLQLPEDEGGNIFCLVNNLLYILSSNANNVIYFNLPEEMIDHFCSLNYYKKDNNYIYYSLVFSDNSKKFNILYYKMNFETEINNLIVSKTYESINSEGNNQILFYINIACEFMKSDSLGKVLVCFHENVDANEIGISFFSPENNLEPITSISNNIYITLEDSLSMIKSVVSKNLKKSLICYLYNAGNGAFCFFFNINDYSYTEPIKYEEYCIPNIMNFRTYFFKKTNNFLFVCGGLSMYFKFIFFNENNEVQIKAEDINMNNCYTYYSISISFLQNSLQYILISDAICNENGENVQLTRFFSIDDFINITNITSITSNVLDSPSSSYIYSYSSNSNENYNPMILKDLICPENLPFFNKEINECVKICSSGEILGRKCIINRVTENNYGEINKIIRQIINNNEIDINKYLDIIIEGNNIIFQLSTTDNIKNNKYQNISKIDFGNCESKIKEKFNIDYIIIQKADFKNNNNTYVKYELYNPNNLKEIIDLSICSEEKILVYTPINITDEYINDYLELLKEGYDISNPNDIFYNDICTPYSSKSDTDMILYDRKITFYNPNLTYCEQGCTFKNIDINEKNVQCECPIKTEEISKTVYQKFNLADSFYKTSKYSNFRVISCFKLVFSQKGQFNNYGSYLLISIIFFYIIDSIVYYSKAKVYNANLIKKLFKSMNLDSNNLLINKKSNPVKKKNKQISMSNNVLVKVSKRPNRLVLNNVKNDNRNESKYESTIKLRFVKKRKNNIKKKVKFENENEKNLKINNYNDEEMNSLEYNEALKIDKRGYFEYYYSLIKKKQIIIFTFILKTDYNLRVVKIALFLITLSLYFTINSFFFVDEAIHIIYEDKGIFNFVFQLPQIFYSTIISIGCNLIIKSLALSENNILKIKKNYNNSDKIEQYTNLFSCLRKKIIIFFIIGFFFLIFFWYFISAFCAVYKNTQIIYLKDCSISFCLSMLYPLIISLIPGIFRIPALRNNKRKFLYMISIFFALL